MELFSLFVFSAIYLAGLGFLIWLPLAWFDRMPGLRWCDFGIVILSGTLLHFIFTLLTVQWGASAPRLLIPAVVGWLGLAFTFVRWEKVYLAAVRRLRMPWLFGFFLIIGIYFFKILFDPLWEHDARSIWFFSAKIMYYAEGFGDVSTWIFPNSYLYHFDYPKLVPTFAAHAAALAGFWNEHLPKLSLFVLFIPIILFLYDLRDRPWSTVFLLLSFLGISGSYLWTGIMDGYLAIYAALSVLFWHYALETKSLRHASISILSLMVVVSLKSEGALFAAVFIFSLIVQQRKRSLIWANVMPYFIVFVPVVIWGILKNRLQLIAEPDFLGGDLFGRVWGRITSGALFHPILSMLLNKPGILQAFIPLAVCVWFAKSRKHLDQLELLPLIIGGLYGCVLVAIYLTTPNELYNHLYYSVERTALPIVFMILLSCTLWIRALEKRLRTSQM